MKSTIISCLLIGCLFFTGCSGDDFQAFSYSDIELRTDNFNINGKNIEWYNETTGEIRFHAENFIEEQKIGRLLDLNMIRVYLQGNYLFDIKVYRMYDSSYPADLAFMYDWEKEIYRIVDYTPTEGDPLYLPEHDVIREEREPGWNLFIEQLKIENRYRK